MRRKGYMRRKGFRRIYYMSTGHQRVIMTIKWSWIHVICHVTPSSKPHQHIFCWLQCPKAPSRFYHNVLFGLTGRPIHIIFYVGKVSSHLSRYYFGRTLLHMRALFVTLQGISQQCREWDTTNTHAEKPSHHDEPQQTSVHQVYRRNERRHLAIENRRLDLSKKCTVFLHVHLVLPTKNVHAPSPFHAPAWVGGLVVC